MTRIERRVLLALQVAEDRGEYASVRELASTVGCTSIGTLHACINGLIGHGYLSRLNHRARAITVLRRIEPIEEIYVWDDEAKELKPWTATKAERTA